MTERGFEITDRGSGKIETTEQAFFTAAKQTDINGQSNGENMLPGNAADCGVTISQLTHSQTIKTKKTQEVPRLQTIDQGQKDKTFMENLR